MSTQTTSQVTSMEQMVQVIESTMQELDKKLNAGVIPVVEITPPENSKFVGAYLKSNTVLYEGQSITEREKTMMRKNPELENINSSVIVNTEMGPVVSRLKPDKECFVQLAAHEYAHYISHLDDQYIKDSIDMGLVDYKLMAKQVFNMLPRNEDKTFTFLKRLDENELMMRLPTMGKIAEEIQSKPEVNENFARTFGANYSDISRSRAVSIKRDIQDELG